MPTETRRERLVPRGLLAQVPTAVVAAVTLVAAFTVAQLSGVRPLGAVLLVAGVIWCVWRSAPQAGWPRIAVVVGAGAVCFVGAHLLSAVVGPWPAVALSAVVLAAVVWWLVDHRAVPAP